jgi:hypothetical protein
MHGKLLHIESVVRDKLNMQVKISPSLTLFYDKVFFIGVGGLFFVVCLFVFWGFFWGEGECFDFVLLVCFVFVLGICLFVCLFV